MCQFALSQLLDAYPTLFLLRQHVNPDLQLPDAFWLKSVGLWALSVTLCLGSAVLAGRAAWLREAAEAGGGIAPEEFPEWGEELLQ